MTKLQVFDPPQCCSTGICGPDVDPELVQFAADLMWLETQGVVTERYNLSQQPEAFVQNERVLKVIQEAGTSALPLILYNGIVVSHTRYPSRDALTRMAGIANDTGSREQDHSAAVHKENNTDQPASH